MTDKNIKICGTYIYKNGEYKPFSAMDKQEYETVKIDISDKIDKCFADTLNRVLANV
jgi:hypothetical protein